MTTHDTTTHNPIPTTRRLHSYTLCWVLLLLTTVATPLYGDRSDRWKERDGWQDVPAIFDAMGLAPGSRVADVGAGRGYLSVRLAKAVGADGRVYAVDIDEERLDDLHRLARDESLPQLTPVHGQPADPRLPKGSLDAVVLVNTYHEIENPIPFLHRLARALRPGGRLVLVDSLEPRHRDDSREEQTASHEIALEFARDDLQAAGFKILDAKDPFVEEPWGDVQWMLVAHRTARRPIPGRHATTPRNPHR